jgi:hypothetical protein
MSAAASCLEVGPQMTEGTGLARSTTPSFAFVYPQMTQKEQISEISLSGMHETPGMTPIL